GDAPLFVSEASRRWPAGRRWSRYMAYNHVRRIADAAKVPVLPPQALRRTQATLAEDAGETALAVARHLGVSAARTAFWRDRAGDGTVRSDGKCSEGHLAETRREVESKWRDRGGVRGA
ncbi:MAG TPA: hypothetical protein VK607_02680, partial [Kofleriaceae bacterium]|nr:hypothetical protein [Kofleriaceae bacterium]